MIEDDRIEEPQRIAGSAPTKSLEQLPGRETHELRITHELGQFFAVILMVSCGVDHSDFLVTRES